MTAMLVTVCVSPVQAGMLGKMQIQPVFEIMQKYDDNIFLEPRHQKNGDWIAVSTLGLELATADAKDIRDQNALFSAQYAASNFTFFKNQSQNRVDHLFHGSTALPLKDFMKVRLEEDFQKTADPPNSELTTLQKRYRNTVQTGFEYDRQDFLVSMRYQNSRDGYNTLQNLNSFEHVISSVWAYQCTPRISIFPEYDFGLIQYDENTTNSDSTYHQWLAGIEGDVSRKLNAMFKVGYRDSMYHDSAKADFHGWVVFSKGTYTLNDRTNVALFGERTVSESSYATNSFFVAHKIDLQLTHQFSSRLSVQSEILFLRNGYPDTTTEGTQSGKRKDSIWGGSLGLRYDLTTVLSLEMKYAFKERESNFAGFDYKNNVYSIQMSARF